MRQPLLSLSTLSLAALLAVSFTLPATAQSSTARPQATATGKSTGKTGKSGTTAKGAAASPKPATGTTAKSGAGNAESSASKSAGRATPPSKRLSERHQQVLALQERDKADPAYQEQYKAASGAEESKELGGHWTLPSRTIVENLARSIDHTMFVAALQAAGMEDHLQKLACTVFAPTDAAIEADPRMLDLVRNARGERLAEALRVYIVENPTELVRLPEAPTQLQTMRGTTLVVISREGQVTIMDPSKQEIKVAIPDVRSANGFINVIDATLKAE